MSIETKVAAESFATAASSGVVRSPAVASGRLRYVDGLRALAILAVVAFHARLPGFRGGFVGVDVFLVISGFLITNQIASQAFSGRFSATDFYARRILRILPPLTPLGSELLYRSFRREFLWVFGGSPTRN